MSFYSVDNEAHCDFVKLREMLIQTNMEDMREKTHTKHYELYRQKQLEQMGFSDVDSDNKPVSDFNKNGLMFLFFTNFLLVVPFRCHFNKPSRLNGLTICPSYKAKKTKCVKCLSYVLRKKKLNSKKMKKR